MIVRKRVLEVERMHVCDWCEDKDCKYCSWGNPCLGCEDYDLERGVCLSNGGCGRVDEAKE